MNSTSELAALQKNHSVIFMIVHDGTIDQDWHGIYTKQAKDKALKAKFAYTTNPEVAEVSVCLCVCSQYWALFTFLVLQEYALRTLPSIIVLKDETAFVFKGN